MKFARHAYQYKHTIAMSPTAVGSGVTLSTISEYELGLSLASETSLLLGTGATLSLPHTSANMTNRLTFQIGEMRTNVEFVAQIYELRQADTTLLADALIDRPDSYELSFKPKGTGTIVLNILYSKYNGIGDSLTSASINLNEFETSITSYETQEVTSTICSGGEDKYRFGFNGQEKVNEIAGIGNHNTAIFWEYDTRLVRRWNLDPKPQISVSDYAVLSNSPIWISDVLGDFYSKRAAIDHIKKYNIEGKVKNLGDGTYDIKEKGGRRFYFGASTTKKEATVKGKKMGYMEGYANHQNKNPMAYKNCFAANGQADNDN